MGPTNVALVKLYLADQALREAQQKLQAASKDVRVQERRVTDLSTRLTEARQKHKEAQASAANLDLDLRAREEHIDKLRNQQSTARNDKEYKALLVEINTQKLDKGKVEEEAIKLMETVEKGTAEVKDLEAQLAGDEEKLTAIKAQIGERLAKLQGEIDALQPARDEAAAAVAKRALDAFNRLADHLEGEAMAAISRPDRRREEYSCTVCMMDLVTDTYNKLHSRDDLVFCPSCKRILYIPEDMTHELATKKKSPARKGEIKGSVSMSTIRSPVAGAAPAAPDPQFSSMPEGWAALLENAARDSVEVAKADASFAVECGVMIDGQLVGLYTAKSPEHLAGIIDRRRVEAGLTGEVVIHRRESIEAASNA